MNRSLNFYSLPQNEQARLSKIHNQIYAAIESDNIDRFREIIHEQPGIDFGLVSSPMMMDRVVNSGSIAMMKELLKMGAAPTVWTVVDKLQRTIRYGSNGNYKTKIIRNGLKIFLFLIAQPGVDAFMAQVRLQDMINTVVEYLRNPDNRPKLIEALAEVHSYIPLYSAEARPILVYLTSIDIENIPELMTKSIEASDAAFKRRAPLLSFRNKTQAALLAKWQAEQAMRESGGGGIGGRRRRRTKRHRRR